MASSTTTQRIRRGKASFRFSSFAVITFGGATCLEDGLKKLSKPVYLYQAFRPVAMAHVVASVQICVHLLLHALPLARGAFDSRHSFEIVIHKPDSDYAGRTPQGFPSAARIFLACCPADQKLPLLPPPVSPQLNRVILCEPANELTFACCSS